MDLLQHQGDSDCKNTLLATTMSPITHWAPGSCPPACSWPLPGSWRRPSNSSWPLQPLAWPLTLGPLTPTWYQPCHSLQGHADEKVEGPARVLRRVLALHLGSQRGSHLCLDMSPPATTGTKALRPTGEWATAGVVGTCPQTLLPSPPPPIAPHSGT